jgi:uncharacterized membrane protein YphA (DoxX/SURF4 family)
LSASIATTGRRHAAAARWVSTAARLVLGGVFLLAGVLKAVDPQSSVAAVRAYQLLPAWTATIVGWGLPFAEIALGLLLLTGIGTRAVAAGAAMLLLIFIAGVVSAAARGLSIDCGCFGGGGAVARGQTAYGMELIRDAGLLLLALWLVWQPRSRLALDPRT